jgi:hypothetical protein
MTHPHPRALEAAARAAYEAAPIVYGQWSRPAMGTGVDFARYAVSWDEVNADAASGDNVCVTVARETRERARAAVTAYIAALQETHALVPRDPTSQMIVAGVAERHGQPVPEAWSLATVNIYRAMIDAAPPAAQDPRP